MNAANASTFKVGLIQMRSGIDPQANLATALAAIESHPGPIDLLVTDVVMRHMSGPELAERLAASHPTLKVVYMSGYTGELMANREELKPGVTLLEKPFSRTALLNIIHTTLG